MCAGEVEADEERREKRVERPDQPLPQLDQMVHQRRLGGVDVRFRHGALGARDSALGVTSGICGALTTTSVENGSPGGAIGSASAATSGPAIDR